MDRDSYLNPGTLKAQCDSAIRKLTQDNETLRTAEAAVTSFTEDQEIKSEAFDALKQQLADYTAIIQSMETANNYDIEDFQTLKNSVGSLVLDGTVIFDNKEKALSSRKSYEDSAERYKMEAAASASLPMPSVADYYTFMAERYEYLALLSDQLIQKLEEREEQYDQIESQTSGLFANGTMMRSAVSAGITDIRSAFRDGGYHPNMDAPWRKEIEMARRRARIMETYGIERPEGMTETEWQKYQTEAVNHIMELEDRGWPEESIQKYVDYINENVADECIGSQIFRELARCSKETGVIGSEVFLSMWDAWEAEGAKESKKKLNTLMKTVGMEELTGEAEQTKRLLEHIDKELAPHDKFWTDLAKLVQEGFPEGLGGSDELSRQVHQFRYVIDAQQVEYVRSHYEGETDEDKLAAYARELGSYPFEWFQDWTTKELDRLHQKYIEDKKYGRKYPDGSEGPNIKITFNEKFHSEFILNKDGDFLYILDPEKDANGIVNGASFNYADGNDDQHQILDVHYGDNDPKFRDEANPYIDEKKEKRKYESPAKKSKKWDEIKAQAEERKDKFKEKVNE